MLVKTNCSDGLGGVILILLAMNLCFGKESLTYNNCIGSATVITCGLKKLIQDPSGSSTVSGSSFKVKHYVHFVLNSEASYQNNYNKFLMITLCA